MKCVLWILGVVLAGFLAGCQVDKQPPGWDYGQAYHTVFNNQKIDPNAGDDNPVVGMPGVKAGMAYDRYEQAAPPKEDQPIRSIMSFGK